jgi:hypothetical protein
MQIHRFSLGDRATIVIRILHAKEPAMNAAPSICLPARQLFVLPDASSARLVCTSGCLWLTLDGDARDIILKPGESFETRERRRAIVYAVERSSFALEAAAPQGTMRRRLSKNRSDWSRSPIVWAATRAASSG